MALLIPSIYQVLCWLGALVLLYAYTVFFLASAIQTSNLRKPSRVGAVMENKKTIAEAVAGLSFRDRLVLAYFSERLKCSSTPSATGQFSPPATSSPEKLPPC